MIDAWRRLACAILKRAVLDARSKNGVASEARRWLEGDPLAGFLLDSIDLDRRVVVAWLAGLPALAQAPLLEVPPGGRGRFFGLSTFG